MSSQREKVSAFFDRAATRYRNQDSIATGAYFDHRLNWALQQLPAKDDDILDVGCGTGLLYDALKKRGLAQGYFGLDASQAMLEHSKIPHQQRAKSFFFDFARQHTRQYEYLYALGFTTYLEATEIDHFFTETQRLLKPGGKAIVSFTNGHALDVQVRQLLQRSIGWLLPRNRSLGRDFPIYATSPAVVRQKAAAAGLQELQTIWLPPVVPLLGFALPAKWAGQRWSPDFLVELNSQ